MLGDSSEKQAKDWDTGLSSFCLNRIDKIYDRRVIENISSVVYFKLPGFMLVQGG